MTKKEFLILSYDKRLDTTIKLFIRISGIKLFPNGRLTPLYFKYRQIAKKDWTSNTVNQIYFYLNTVSDNAEISIFELPTLAKRHKEAEELVERNIQEQSFRSENTPETFDFLGNLGGV